MGWFLSIDELPGQDAEQLKAWLEPILNAMDAELLVSDDADAFKTVSDETGRAQQVCKSHVGRNTDALVTELSAMIRGRRGSFSGSDQCYRATGIGRPDGTQSHDPFPASRRPGAPGSPVSPLCECAQTRQGQKV